VPGSYRVDVRMLKSKVCMSVHVITSNDPEDHTAGRDGRDYVFLLKDTRTSTGRASDAVIWTCECFTDSGPADEEVRSEDSALCYFAAFITVAWLKVPNTGDTSLVTETSSAKRSL
jgi:hypothetical protein